MANMRNIIKLLPQKFNGDYDSLYRFRKGLDFALESDPSLSEPGNAGIKLKIIEHIVVNLLDQKTFDLVKDKIITTVDELHKILKQELLKSIEPETILAQINESNQKPFEKIEDFARRIKKLKEKFQDAHEINNNVNLTPIKAYHEKLIIKAFVRGTNPQLRNILLTQKFESIDDAITYAVKKQQEINSFGFY